MACTLSCRRWWGIVVIFQVSSFLSVTVASDEFEAHANPEAEVEIDVHGNTKNTDSTPTTNQSANLPDFVDKCGIWLAPSAIEGAGLGMYAGKSFEEGSVFQVMGDIVVPIADMKMHNQRSNYTFLWEEYYWNGPSLGIDHEAYIQIDGCSSGFGSTANSFIPVYNVEEGLPKRGTEGLHRAKDPGVGAFTHYYDREITATRQIDAGEELYVNYGDHWFKHRTKTLGAIPLGDDLERATQLFLAFGRLKKDVDIDSEKMDEFWDFFVRNNIFKDSRVFGSFRHDNRDEMEQLESFRSMRRLRLAQATKTREWLYEHGTCGDHIYGGSSTIEQAGRGAFASWDLKAGWVVSQLPLIHISNRTLLNMYNFDKNEEQGARILGNRPAQLLLNYCFGHGESTLLLCNYGPNVNYVNHNQTRANVKIQWADPQRGNFMPHLLQEPLEKLELDSFAKLAFELVATRDIAKDEEIFLDYGDAWEAAWQNHVESWEPVEGAEGYVAPDDFMENEEELLRTDDELETNPYPENLRIQCNDFFWEEDWADLSPKKHKARMDDYDFFDCHISEKYPDEEVEEMFWYTGVPDDEQYDPIEGLPDYAFRLIELPYKSDMFLQNAFRHDIRIPDEIFPETWKNRKSE